MQAFSVRKGGFDVNEFSDRVLVLERDGVTWRVAEPADVPPWPDFAFGGYNNKNDPPDDNALDATRSIASIARQIGFPYETVCCLWPGLGESKLEAMRFHQAIRNARKAAAMYAVFFNSVPDLKYMVSGHSLGCGLIGFLLARMNTPATDTIWMGAAVPQYATAYVDPAKEDSDRIGKITGRLTNNSHRFDFAHALATNTKKLINVIGDDPVLEGPFELAVNEKACGAHGCWPGPERIPNAIDIDLRAVIKKHGHYRHYVPMWHQLLEHVRNA